MTDRTCKTCRWWKKPGQFDFIALDWIRGWGTCEFTKEEYKGRSKSQVWGESFTGAESLMTAPDFGCNQWEEIP